MLMKELRRDRAPPEPSAPSEDLDDSRHQQRSHDGPRADAINVEDSMSISDRFKFYWIRAVTWYHGQPEDVKTLLKGIVGMVVLYVMFGGRFGLGGNQSVRGHYGKGNAYDRYRGTGGYDYGGGNTGYRPPGAATNINAGTRNYGAGSGGYQRQAAYEEDYGYHPRQGSSWGGSSFHFPNLMDGSLPSMMILGVIMYGAHRMGVNPFQLLMMMNMMGGGRRRHGMGYGMAGMGYGMARNAGMFGRGAPNHRPGYY